MIKIFFRQKKIKKFYNNSITTLNVILFKKIKNDLYLNLLMIKIRNKISPAYQTLYK